MPISDTNLKKLKKLNIQIQIIKNGFDLTNISKFLPEIENNKNDDVKCYILGDKRYKSKIKNSLVFQNHVKWMIETNFNNVSEVISSDRQFLDKLSEEKKNKQDRFNPFLEKIEEFKSSVSWMTNEEIAGFLMAAEEMQEMKIFPETEENIYNAFLKTVMLYIPDKKRAEEAIKIYLKQ